MSIFSNLVGKIPVIGHALNQVGKVLPSGGQIIGNLAGPIGGLIGGSIDGNTTPLQKKIGIASLALPAAVAGAPLLGGAAGALGGAASALGGKLGGIDLGSILKGAGGALGLGGAGGGIDLGKLADAGLGTAALVNQSKLQGQSTDYANNAFKSANDAYNSRAPLRTAGVAGMLNPQSGVDLGALQASAGQGNPFAVKRPPPIPMGQV